MAGKLKLQNISAFKYIASPVRLENSRVFLRPVPKFSRPACTKSLGGGPSTSVQNPQWKIKMLYDGECPLCMREVNMLRERNKFYKAINFVDISSNDFSAEENGGIDYENAMGRIHAISSDGEVFTNVQAFKKLYEVVGLGWVYAITKYEPFASIAEALYSVWAKYRLQITGRPPLVEVLKSKNTCKIHQTEK